MAGDLLSPALSTGLLPWNRGLLKAAGLSISNYFFHPLPLPPTLTLLLSKVEQGVFLTKSSKRCPNHISCFQQPPSSLPIHSPRG